MMHRLQPFQWLVDISQRQPQWWCKKMAALMVLCVAMYGLLFSSKLTHDVVIACAAMGVNAFVVFDAARNPEFLTFLGGVFARFWLVTAVAQIAWGVHLEWDKHIEGPALCAYLFFAALMAFLAFADCKPPSSSKRKHALAKQQSHS